MVRLLVPGATKTWWQRGAESYLIGTVPAITWQAGRDRVILSLTVIRQGVQLIISIGSIRPGATIKWLGWKGIWVVRRDVAEANRARQLRRARSGNHSIVPESISDCF